MTKIKPYDFMRLLSSDLTKDPNEISVLMMLHLFKNSETGDCFPSYDLLAKSCKVSISTLHRTLSSLKNRGLISWTHGKNNRNNYKMFYETIPINALSE
jgi:DNA-binding MarR family transcriptional regulator